MASAPHTRIHPTAIVASGAVIADSAEVGPYCVVGGNVTLHDGVRLISHVVVDGHTTIGPHTVVHPFASLGMAPQHLRYKGEPSRLVIGSHNVIREHATMHTGTEAGGMETRVGSNCLFMVGTHVAHDCVVGNNIILTNDVALGGHVHVEDHAILGGLCSVHQYVRIGKHAMVGLHSCVERDVIPYGLAVGNRIRLTGLNIIGLRRRGFTREDIRTLQTAYGLLFAASGTLAERVAEVAELYSAHPLVMDIIDFIRADSTRPICLPSSSGNGNGNG